MLTNYIRLEKSACFHARPAADVVRIAQKYKSLIILTANGQIADAKKILSVMQLAAPADCIVEITVDGVDEAEALQGMEDTLTNMKW